MDHEIDDEDWGSPLTHMIAGAVAGTTEHCGMFPIDTIKTHIQAFHVKTIGTAAATAGASQSSASLVQGSILGVFRSITHQSGVRGLFRGLSAMIMGAAPAHAVYFAVYETSKERFGGNEKGSHHPVATFSAGVLATIASDAVLTPMDSIKQKMQLGLRRYNGLTDCIKHTYKTHGLAKGFYAAYTTTLFMNVPYSGIYFASYEFFKKVLHPDDPLSDAKESPLNYCLAGGGAGVVSAAFTNPLDVAKTRLQTQSDSLLKYRGMVHTLRLIWTEEGFSGLLSGIRPRMLFHSTAAAICWFTYEHMKMLLA